MTPARIKITYDDFGIVNRGTRIFSPLECEAPAFRTFQRVPLSELAVGASFAGGQEARWSLAYKPILSTGMR
jgi:hypothetical protein